MQTPSADARLLEALRNSGADLALLHRFEFLLRFPTQEAAENAASQLVELAFAVEIAGEAEDDHWSVQAVKRMYPVESDLLGLRDKLEVIARSEGGTYEGWQARAVEQ